MNNTEEDAEKKIQEKKDKIKSWLMNWENLALVGILVFAFAIRLYYFSLTKNQPLWWDELCYGSLAKNFISHTWDGTPLIVGELVLRPLIFSYIWAFFLLLGFGESANRFILAVIPSVISVFFIYLIGKESYGKRTGLIAAFIFSIMWMNLFYSVRFLVHMLELSFLTPSIYFFIKSIKGEDINLKQYAISLLFLCFSTLTRYQDGMIFFIYFFILIFAKKLYLNRIKFWYFSAIGFLPLISFFLINFVTKGNFFPALGTLKPAPSPEGAVSKFGFYVLNYIPTFLTKIFFILFLIGLAYILFDLFLGYNLLARDSKRRDGVMFILLIILFNVFLIFFLRGGEDRWLFETLISLSIICAVGIEFCAGHIKRYSKIASIIFILLILIIGAYSQVTFADSLIKSKKDSYLQMRDAFLWMKDNTPKDSISAGSGTSPYSIYYSNRKYADLGYNSSENPKIDASDYFVMHWFINQPKYLTEYILNNTNKLEPIKVEMFNAQQPAVIVYRVLK